MADENKSLDFLGAKPIAESINTAANGVVAFLGAICMPAADEFGAMLKDNVHAWRMRNLEAITCKTQELLNQNLGTPTEARANARIVSNIVEEGSWIDDPIIQDFWAGLLASSCTEDGDDDSNLLFVNLLANLTKLQARILDYLCEYWEKSTAHGLIYSNQQIVETSEFTEIFEEADIQRLDREMDHLRGLGLIQGGFHIGSADVFDITPTSLALHMYVRCQGSRQSPIDYFGLSPQLPSHSD